MLPTIRQQRRDVLLLALCQGLFVCSQSTLFLVGGLVGFALTPDKAWATLPVTCTVLGTATMMIPASLYMRRVGRRIGFMSGACLAIVGGVVAATAIAAASFWLFCLGTFLFGCYHAFCQYYRFAAADTAEPAFKAKALSLVLAGGVVAGFIGPELANQTRMLISPFSYLGTVLMLSGLALTALLLVSLMRLPRPASDDQPGSGRPLAAIMTQPRFIIAVLASMIGYGVMSLVMTATPLAMIACGFPDKDAGFVIQWHILGMFGPSFFTGILIARFGLAPVMWAGVAALAGTFAFTLTGIAIENFWIGLILLGIGWNFLFVGGSTLLTECYAPVERAKTQAAHDFLAFATTAFASFLSGALLAGFGWTTVNLIAMPFVAAAALVVGGLAWSRRRSARPA